VQIICVSRGTLSGGKVLAEKLAHRLGYPCLSREDLIEAAFAEGIQVGKLETAMVKGGRLSERLAVEKEYYQAFSTQFLCEKASAGPLVYHGRTGHLLLSGVEHLLRVRVVADPEFRIRSVMAELGVTREKARRYIEDVDEDRRRWVHAMYGVSWEDVAHYDVVINLQAVSLDNAAAALTAIAALPDFQLPPASLKTLENMRIAARARVMLARDERTHAASFKVSFSEGVLTVTYLPHASQAAPAIPEILKGLDGVREVRTTMATTSLLWIQESFDPTSESFRSVTRVASKWGAAVELLRLAPGETPIEEPAAARSEPVAPARDLGGIEDEVEAATVEDPGVKATADALATLGLSGGHRTVSGSPDRLLEAMDRSVPYSLIVVGDVYLSKGHAARTRLARELCGFLGERLKVPAVGVEDLKSRYLFGRGDLIRMIGFACLVAVLFFLILTNQEAILRFFVGQDMISRGVAAVAAFVIVPVVAYLYGTVARLLLKMIRME